MPKKCPPLHSASPPSILSSSLSVEQAFLAALISHPFITTTSLKCPPLYLPSGPRTCLDISLLVPLSATPSLQVWMLHFHVCHSMGTNKKYFLLVFSQQIFLPYMWLLYLYSPMRKVLSWLLECESTLQDFVFFKGKGPYLGYPVFSSGKIITLKTCCYFMGRIREWYFHDNFFDDAYTKSMNKTFVLGPCPHVIIVRSLLLICRLKGLSRSPLWTKEPQGLVHLSYLKCERKKRQE